MAPLLTTKRVEMRHHFGAVAIVRYRMRGKRFYRVVARAGGSPWQEVAAGIAGREAVAASRSIMRAWRTIASNAGSLSRQ